MPIEIEGRQNGVGIIYNCHGTLSIEDFFRSGAGFLVHPEEISKWRYCLIDLSRVDDMNITSGDIRTVVEQNKRIAALAPPGAIIAVASPKDLGFGLARVWEVFVEEVGWETMTFRSRAAAEAWIGERLLRKFGIALADSSSAPLNAVRIARNFPFLRGVISVINN